MKRVKGIWQQIQPACFNPLPKFWLLLHVINYTIIYNIEITDSCGHIVIYLAIFTPETHGEVEEGEPPLPGRG